MSVTDEHRMSPSKILAKSKKDKDGDKDKKEGGAVTPKSNAMLDFISKCKSKAKD